MISPPAAKALSRKWGNREKNTRDNLVDDHQSDTVGRWNNLRNIPTATARRTLSPIFRSEHSQ